jgi:HEAT repeat protein
LLQVLQDPQESDIVRHEAAEALGDMVTPEILPYLKEYMTREDAPDVVKESCELALGNYEVKFSPFSRLVIVTQHWRMYSTRTPTNLSTSTARLLWKQLKSRVLI